MADQIREVMTSDPACVESSSTAREAASLMKDRDVGAIVVTDGGEAKGIVTDRDIAVRAVAEGKNPSDTQVQEICTSDPTTLGPDDSVEDAAKAMRENNIRRLPVVDGGKPVGIVSLGDVSQQRDAGETLADISAAAPNN
jgi:CBS domain-containing protein